MSDIENSKNQINNILKMFKDKYSSLAPGKVDPNIINNIIVNVYGSATKIRDIASVNIVNSNSLEVVLFDQENKNIVKSGLDNSSIGFSSVTFNKDNHIIVVLPPLTISYLENIFKQLKISSEEFKIKMRNVRRDFLDEIKKLYEKDKPKVKSFDEKITDIVNNHIKEIDILLDNFKKLHKIK